MNHELEPSHPHSEIALGEIGQILRRRVWVFLAILLACLCLAAFATHKMSKHWRSVAQMVLIERATNSSAIKQTYAPPIVETVDTQMAMLQSDAMPQRTLDWLKANVGPHDPRVNVSTLTPQILDRAITVTNPKDTDVFLVSADAKNPQQAALFADAFCQAFLAWKGEVARQQVTAIANSLQIRSDHARSEMLNAERQETEFKQHWHVADVAAQEKSLLDQYQAQQTGIDDIQKEAFSLKARLGELEKQLKAQNADLASGGAVRDDTLVTALQSQLTQLESDRADAAQKYTEKYPGVLSGLDAKIHDTKGRLDAAIHGILSGKVTSLQSQGALLADYQQTEVSEIYTEAKLAAANREAGRIQKQIAQMPALDAQYKQLTRNVDLTNTLYLSVQSDLASARLDAEIASGSVQVTQKAVLPDRPYRPNAAQNLALGGLAGLFLASLAVVLLEQTDRRVRDRADVQRITQGVILGALPPVASTDAQMLTGPDAPPFVLETYRRAYANLLLALRRTGPTPEGLQNALILVTSAGHGEGTSLTATQLARAIAGSGKRTILVDANLDPMVEAGADRGAPHTPTVAPYGLSDVLRGTVLAEEALAVTDHYHLLQIGRGRPGADADDMFSQPKMEQTLNALRASADVVVVDAPPCSERADAFFLAPQADCIVQVVGAGRVSEAALRETSEGLTAAAPRLMAYFLNFSQKQDSGQAQGSRTRRRGGRRRSERERRAAERNLLQDNKTTEVTVRNVPGRPPLVRLSRPPAPPLTPEFGEGAADVTWLHLEEHIRSGAASDTEVRSW